MGQNGNLHNFNIVFKVHLGVRPRSTGWSEEAVLAGGRSNQSPPNVSNETKIFFFLIIPPKKHVLPGPDEHEHQVQHHQQKMGAETSSLPKLCASH